MRDRPAQGRGDRGRRSDGSFEAPRSNAAAKRKPCATLHVAMRKSRPWLLLLVALILPMKGAMAAAGMLCHANSTVPASSVAASDHDHDDTTRHDHAHSAAAHDQRGGG